MLKVNRTAFRYEPVRLPDEDEVRAEIIEKVSNYGRVGYRKVTHMLRNDGRKINHKRVERIWREEGLKLPHKQPRKRRLFLNDGSCIRLRPEHRNHVWSYDFVEDRTMDGRKLRFLNIIDEYTRECLASIPRRSWRGTDVMEALADIMGVRNTSAATTGPSSLPRNYANGFQAWVLSRPTSNRAAPGRTATARVSTAGCGMSF